MTPVYYPAPGGGAIYSKILAAALARAKETELVTVVTEAYNGQPRYSTAGDGRVHIRRSFPFRAGRSQRDWLSYLAYSIQAIQLLDFDRLLPRAPDVLLVHSSIHYNPTFIGWGLARFRRHHPEACLILDVRDPLLPQRMLNFAGIYDAVIGCSKRIETRIRSIMPEAMPVRHIPVAFSPVSVSREQIDRVLDRRGLTTGGYLLATSGVVRAKGIEETVQLAQVLRRDTADLKLVIVGRAREAVPEVDAAIREGWLMMLGPTPHEETLALMAGSVMHVNLSLFEGLPRASLEAMWLGTRVLLPRGIQEFNETVPHLVAPPAEDFEAVVARAGEILAAPARRPAYPFASHFIDSVCAQYIALSDELIGARIAWKSSHTSASRSKPSGSAPTAIRNG